MRTGMEGSEGHMLAHRVIEEAGYGDYFGHGLGHGVGLQIHESPRLSRALTTSGRRHGRHGRAGIYLPGWGGIRIEDMGYMKDGKYVSSRRRRSSSSRARKRLFRTRRRLGDDSPPSFFAGRGNLCALIIKKALRCGGDIYKIAMALSPGASR